jgi:hypothetical protein
LSSISIAFFIVSLGCVETTHQLLVSVFLLSIVSKHHGYLHRPFKEDGFLLELCSINRINYTAKKLVFHGQAKDNFIAELRSGQL